MAVRVKVCGLTSASDARLALEAGADALGFVFHPASPRSIDLAAWRAIRPALPPWSSCVAVFATGDEPCIGEVLGAGGFTAFQVRAAAPAPVDAPPGVRFFRAFDPDQDELAEAEAFLAGGPERALLLDPRRGTQAGGTGERAGLEATREWLARFPEAVLAGGLDHANVAEAVAVLRPWGVDASSRLESEPGRKDPERVRAFVRNAKGSHGPQEPR